MNINPNYAVQVRGLAKSFGLIKALDCIDLDISKNTIHAIYGENGAGKTTLLNILYGLETPDAGQIYIEGNEVELRNPKQALGSGIGMVHQSAQLIEEFSVIENVILGKEPQKKGFINWEYAYKTVKKLADKYKFDIDIEKKVNQLTVGKKQIVELLKVLYYGCDLILLDEPTANLNDEEVEQLKNLFQLFINEKRTIVIITHKLKEIIDFADYCTIIENGKTIRTLATNDPEFTSRVKTYNNPVEQRRSWEYSEHQIILQVKELVSSDNDNRVILDNVSFDIYRGEIFGIVGVEDAAQVRLCECIFSEEQSNYGVVLFNGLEIQNTNPSYAAQQGISFIPDDRKKGLFLRGTLYDNLLLNYNIRRESSRNHRIAKELLSKYIGSIPSKYHIKMGDINRCKVGELSGGNQQKILIGREIEAKHDLLIAIQPTAGLDVDSAERVYNIMIEEKKAGKAILLISYDIDEILRLSDRISVMKQGRLSTSFSKNDTNREFLMKSITG